MLVSLSFGFEKGEKKLFWELEEKVEMVSVFLQKMEKAFLNNIEAKNQFVFFVEEKNRVLQEALDLLTVQFLGKRLQVGDPLFEKKLVAIHSMVAPLLKLKEEPTWGELKKLKEGLSSLQSLYVVRDLPKKRDEEKKPKKGRRFLDSSSKKSTF